jgi:hypothetical protein
VVRLYDVQLLLDAPSPAVLTTYRKDGTALTTPVWFRFHAGAFEVVLAEGDVKREHLVRTPRCILVVFEAVPPFRGVEVKGQPELIDQDVTEVREAIAAATSEKIAAVDLPRTEAPEVAHWCGSFQIDRVSGILRLRYPHSAGCESRGADC